MGKLLNNRDWYIILNKLGWYIIESLPVTKLSAYHTICHAQKYALKQYERSNNRGDLLASHLLFSSSIDLLAQLRYRA